MIKNISILGSTGSIGVSTIDLVRRHPDKFRVIGLAAGGNLKLLAEQVRALKPKMVSVNEGDTIFQKITYVDALKELLKGIDVEIVSGVEGACNVASLPEVDLVISAIVGAAGLLPTLRAIESGKTIGLANKESMVIAGELMRQKANQHQAQILPVDSEHSAIFQCLQGNRREDVQRLILTASGGPFLHKPVSEFGSITKAEALRHPNWSMGEKITIDSATMMNKGLEVMEARWLFDLAVEKVDVCIHPQSIVHSMVEYKDGSVMAQLGVPDMKVPIAYALSYPERIETGVASLNLFEKKELTFFEPDFEKFRCLKLAYDVGRKGGTYPAVLNAANEIVVDSFLKGTLKFLEIPKIIEAVLEKHQSQSANSLENILLADQWARDLAIKLVYPTTWNVENV